MAGTVASGATLWRAMAAVDIFFGSRLARLRRELAELRSRLATTRHLARLHRKDSEAAQRRPQAPIEEARRLLEAAPRRNQR
jgi:hypothetical protein